jgi:hypothetical protein
MKKAKGGKMDILTLLLGVLAILYGILYLLGKLGATSPRAAFIVLLLFGVVLCVLGMKIGQFGWTSPWTILGIVFGVLALLLVLGFFLGWKLPYVASERAYVAALLIVIAVKVVIGLIRDLVGKN